MSRDVKQELRCYVGEDLVELGDKSERSVSSTVCFESDYPSLVDLWFINDHTLRIRFGEAGANNDGLRIVRLFQSDFSRETSPVLVAESPLNYDAPTIFDAALANPYLPVLMTATTADGGLISASVLPFPSLCRAGAHYGELCAQMAQESYLEKLRSFSGALLSELFADPADAGHLRLAQIDVDLQGATGAERIFLRPMLEWLAGVMHIKLAPTNAAAVKQDKVRAYLESSLGSSCSAEASLQNKLAVKRARHGALVLTMPADGIPSLNCLVSRNLDIPAGNRCALGSFVFAEAATGDPKWLVTVPPMNDELFKVQPVATAIGYPVLTRVLEGEDTTKNLGCGPFAVSLRFGNARGQNEAQLLMPSAPDAPGPILRVDQRASTRETGRISVILPSRANASETLPAFVESLRLQTIAEVLDIVVNIAEIDTRANFEKLLRAHFPGRFRLIECAGGESANVGINFAGDHAAGEFLLFCTDSAILYDPRTVETLRLLADNERVASASCVQLQENPTKKGDTATVFRCGGILPSAADRPATAGLRFSEPDCHAIFPCATYPVAANSASLFMVRTDIWKKLGGFRVNAGPDGYGEIEYGIRAISQGYHHICTSAVAAGLRGADLAPTYSDVHLPIAGDQRICENLASASCVIRALRG